MSMMDEVINQMNQSLSAAMDAKIEEFLAANPGLTLNDIYLDYDTSTPAQIDVVDGVYHLTQDFPKIKIRPMKSEVVGIVGDGAVEQEMSKYIGRPVKLTIEEVSG